MTDVDRTVRMEDRGEIDVADLGWQSARKQPVVVEATPMPGPFEVETMEGTMEGDAGDVLIRGVGGELYPCDSEVFAQTYELVDGDTADDDASPGSTAVSNPNYLKSQSCDWHVDPEDEGTHCGESPAAYVGDIYYACEEHFEDLAEWLETPSPIVHLIDGPRLILADGSVVRPLVADLEDGHELAFVGDRQGASVYGDALGVNETASIAFVDDPDAATHDLVERRREALEVATDAE